MSFKVATPPSARMIIPATTLANGVAGLNTWPSANAAYFARFYLPVPGSYRYLRFQEGVASGNIQAAVVSISGTDETTFNKVMDSGIIAAPTAGMVKLDLGTSRLNAGEYALALWADNVIVTLPNGGASSGISGMWITSVVTGLVGGIPANGVLTWGNTTRFISLTLEAA